MKMINDEIVDEIHAVREAHAAKFDYNLHAIYEDLKKSESEHIANGHAYISPPAVLPAPHSTYSGLVLLAD